MADTNQTLERIAQSLGEISDSLKRIAEAMQNASIDNDLQTLNRLVGEVAERLPTP